MKKCHVTYKSSSPGLTFIKPLKYFPNHSYHCTMHMQNIYKNTKIYVKKTYFNNITASVKY